MESSSNERDRSASTYPCISRAEAFKRTGLMEIQQHDGVVVEVAGSRQGFTKPGRKRCHGREGGARASGVAALPPLHYI